LKNRKLYTYLLILILSLGAFFRIFHLGSNPNGLHIDEAFNGYTAFSLIETKRDTCGIRFPIFFARQPTIYFSSPYIYASVPFVFLFGLSELSVRLTAAFLGVLTIGLTYLCVKQLLGRRIALISSFLLSISPWHIQFSRIALRSVMLPCCFIVAVYLLQKSLRKKLYIYFGFLALGLTAYTYSSANIFVPLFILAFLIIYRGYLIEIKKETTVALLIFVIIFIPVVIQSSTPPGNQYFKKVSYIGSEFRFGYVKEFATRYIEYFSPKFLFFSGGSDPRFNLQYSGLLYFFEFPLLLIGLYIMITRRSKEHLLLLSWLFIYPISASLTSSHYHACRSINAIPVFQIITAQGAYSLFRFIKKREKVVILLLLFFIIGIVNVSFYFYNYFFLYPKYSAPAWQYGYRNAISYIEGVKKEYSRVVISSKLRYPYELVLFYTQYNPSKYQKNPVSISKKGVKGIIGKYHFRSSDRDEYHRSLYLSPPQQWEGLTVKKTIFSPGGQPLLQVGEYIE